MGRIANLIDEQQARRPGPRCRIAVILDQYPHDERDEWTAVLADTTIQHAQIARAFTADGSKVSDQIVGHHRKGECACG